MNVLLVYPATPETFWSFKHVLRFVSKRAAFPPLGLLTVAAMLPTDWQIRGLAPRATCLLAFLHRYAPPNWVICRGDYSPTILGRPRGQSVDFRPRDPFILQLVLEERVPVRPTSEPDRRDFL